MRVKFKCEEEARRFMEVRIKDFPKIYNVENIYFATDMQFEVVFKEFYLIFTLKYGTSIIEAFLRPAYYSANWSVKDIKNFMELRQAVSILSVLEASGELLEEEYYEN